MRDIKDLFLGSLIGGAIGDALGYPVEFMKMDKIKDNYGKDGIVDLEIDYRSGKALVSDDTQMTIFTADGILWCKESCADTGGYDFIERGIYQSYLGWNYTQTKIIPIAKNAEAFNDVCIREEKDNILNCKELLFRRDPGNTCLTALGSGKIGTIKEPINNSKGCGGVMRVAPVGLFFYNDTEFAFKIGSKTAAITHGHPTGYLAAGALCSIIAGLVQGECILSSIKEAIRVLESYEGNQETIEALNKAIHLATSDLSPEVAIARLGQGWVAEEALAIAIYCALKETDFKKALIMAVNHDGDSDSTGAICGNIIGATYGVDCIPQDWLNKIELKDLITTLSNKLFESDK